MKRRECLALRLFWVYLWQPLNCNLFYQPLDARPTACAEIITVLLIALLMICSGQATLGPSYCGIS